MSCHIVSGCTISYRIVFHHGILSYLTMSYVTYHLQPQHIISRIMGNRTMLQQVYFAILYCTAWYESPIAGLNLLVYVMQNVLHVFCLIPYCLRLFCFITSASLHCVLQFCSGCIMLHRKCCITVFWFFNIVYDCIVQYAMQNILYCTAFRCIMFYCTI